MSKVIEHEIEVVGIKFRWKRDLREQLAKKIGGKGLRGIVLEREPDNKYDANAITVALPDTFDLDGHANHLGYIGRESAEVLAPKLDSGELEIRGATLMSLDTGNDYNTGTMLVTFKSHD